MGVTWADFDHDGCGPLRRNMFSSAGNRIAFDRRFQADASADALGHSSDTRAATASSSRATARSSTRARRASACGRGAGLAFDLNNDGWQDIYVPNGFVTGTNPDDL